jgi:phosphoribosylaminoimidazole-succinocarboxamide synthase
LEDKGKVNNIFNAFIMEKLEAAGIKTHFEKRLSETESLVKKLEMIPVECVVRNLAAGSLCKRYGIEEGLNINPPTFEFFLKNDELHDPMINDYHIVTFGWATQADIDAMKKLTFEVNAILKNLFLDAGMLLVDYKLEFGLYKGEIILGDEFSPDGCRIWDSETRNKMDKDRFRQKLGNVIDTYKEVGQRLGINF